MALDGIYLSLLRKEFDPLIDGRGIRYISLHERSL